MSDVKISEEYLNNFLEEQLFLTPLENALTQLKERGKDLSLKLRVEDYLNNDIPPYFKNEQIGYLARHVATPNFETIHFLNICKQKKLPAFIGQDSGDIFVSHNDLKRALGKLAVHASKRQDDPIFTYNTVVDFYSMQGRHFRDVKTHWGESLIEFHNNLFKHFYDTSINIFDDASWVDRNHRGDLLEHYKKFLSLLVVHGIMFEYYLKHDLRELKFVKEILIPAFIYVEEKFGHRPLIVSLVDEGDENMDWYGYPKFENASISQPASFINNKQVDSTNI